MKFTRGTRLPKLSHLSLAQNRLRDAWKQCQTSDMNAIELDDKGSWCSLVQRARLEDSFLMLSAKLRTSDCWHGFCTSVRRRNKSSRPGLQCRSAPLVISIDLSARSHFQLATVRAPGTHAFVLRLSRSASLTSQGTLSWVPSAALRNL